MSTLTPAPAEPLFQLRSSPSSATSPRLGSVLGRLATPHVLTYTQHGLPPHLTVDNWPHLPDMTAFHIPIAALLSQPSAAALASPHYPSPSLASYLRYPSSSFLLLSLSEPLLPVQHCNDSSVVVASPQGNQRVTPLQFVQRARTLRPDAVLLVSDGHTAGSEAERGREKKAVWRSGRWLNEQLHSLYGASETALGGDADSNEESGERKSKRQRKLDKQDEVQKTKDQLDASVGSGHTDGQLDASAAATVPALSAARHVKPPYVIAPVPLMSDTALQQQYVNDMLGHSQLIDGYSIAIAPANPETTLSLLPSLLTQLPISSLRVCSSHPPSLSSLFAVVCSGIDLVSTTLPYQHSLLGLALSLHSPALSLHSASLSTSALPLAADCHCYTCQHHTRAYVHHLLRVKEMTGTVLLDLHNTHTVMELMRLVRERLGKEGLDGWQQWRDEWLQRFEVNERLEKEERERETQKKQTAEMPIAPRDKIGDSFESSGPQADVG